MASKADDKEFARNAFLIAVAAGGLALGVLAALAIFRAVAAENWWMIALNAWQVVFAAFVWFMFANLAETPRKYKCFIMRVIVGSLLLVVLHSVWQAVVEHSGVEEVGERNRRDLYLSYIGLAILRLLMFVLEVPKVVLMFI